MFVGVTENKLSIILDNYSKKIGPDKVGILLNTACLSATARTDPKSPIIDPTKVANVIHCQRLLTALPKEKFEEYDTIFSVINFLYLLIKY